MTDSHKRIDPSRSAGIDINEWLAASRRIPVLSIEEARGYMGLWVPASASLPPEGVYVLARHTRGTWEDHNDPEGVNHVVVCRRTRLGLQSPSDYICPNNRTHFEWSRFGPGGFNGQEVSHWMYFSRVEEQGEMK